ncbi:hypothetical protein [Streptomyces sp. NPDC052107]|uniref:hypothetical protein n=1 Tax=Streptomyces sp. NPDC052107 TaxID=3155632 RepID=UPI003429F6E7
MAIDSEDEFTDVYRAHCEDVLRFVRRRAHPMNVDDIVGRSARSGAYLVQVMPQVPRIDLAMFLLMKVEGHADVRRLAELD